MPIKIMPITAICRDPQRSASGPEIMPTLK
jgi:hypothetical protein